MSKATAQAMRRTHFSPAELARMTGKSVWTFYRLLYSRQIEGVRLGERGGWLIPISECRRLLGPEFGEA